MTNASKLFQSDQNWMHKAIAIAEQTAQRDQEIPVAAIIVLDKTIIAQGTNQVIQTCDPTAHAEIVALRQASKLLNNYRLTRVSIYVTLEPCLMCLGALIQARVKRLVFGAYEPQANPDHLYQASQLGLEYLGGVLAHEYSPILKNFFKKRRSCQ